MFILKRLVQAGILLFSFGVLADSHADPSADPSEQAALPPEMIVTTGPTAVMITDPHIASPT